ncbi:hypothetical protein HD597_001183 [Nonomuraea thailandensis]|uniref:Uncharacterized protein n=1 Tax=Nonomuraea thailandensis TaxID=1188745 RepID=A0A9X2GHE3_9ACTN|nr:hypothetical protein [Nonomuraea thailandensis]
MGWGLGRTGAGDGARGTGMGMGRIGPGHGRGLGAVEQEVAGCVGPESPARLRP